MSFTSETMPLPTPVDQLLVFIVAYFSEFISIYHCTFSPPAFNESRRHSKLETVERHKGSRQRASYQIRG